MSETRLEQLSKRFGDVVAVDDLSLTVAEGELVTLLGPSGCGKSTTLQIITGLTQADQGEVFIGGVAMGDTPPHKRKIGVVFQHGALFPHKTVVDNVAFGLKMRRIAKEERRRRAQSMLDRVHLSGLGDRYPRELSGGQQQRVALARSLVVEPHVLLLDEPLSALDLNLRQQLRVEIRELQHEFKTTTILVTHDQIEAMSMSDRVAVMNRGRLEQVGTPESIYLSPESRFVAGFIGEANLLHGVVEERTTNGTCIAMHAGLKVRVRPGILTPGARVVAVVRPESVAMGPIDGRIRHGSAEGDVVLKYFLGATVRFELTLRSDTRVFLDAPRESPESHFSAGDRVSVWLSENDVFCFPEG